MQIYVTDAQYVYRGDPNGLPPNHDSTQPYFKDVGFCGISGVMHPYHHSCTTHLYTQEEETEDATETEENDSRESDGEWDYLFPKIRDSQE